MTASLIYAPTPESIRRAASELRSGNLIGLPTETVYGLAANGTCADAVAKIYAAKNRPAINPLILHVASADQARQWTRCDSAPWLSQQFDAASALWPGPLTIVLPRASGIPNIVTAGGDTVGIRVPSHPVALALLAQCDFPVAAPSANPSNYISPTTAQHVVDGLGDRVAMVLDGGACTSGVESTIIRLHPDGPEILRWGGLTRSQLEAAIGMRVQRSTPNDAESNDAESSNAESSGERNSGERSSSAGAQVTSGVQSATPLAAPGQLSRHYSPSKPLWIVGVHPIPDDVSRLARIAFSSLTADQASKYAKVWTLSETGDLAEVARGLFASLRSADQSDVDAIVIDSCSRTGLGVAIMDRINRGAR